MKAENLLENLILENKNGLYRLAYSYVRNKEDSLDIVQEAIYKAFKNYNPNKVTNIRAWLYGILVNTAIDTIRKNKKYILYENKDMSEKEIYFDNYENIDLYDVLNGLEPKYREIIVMRYFQDLKINEIAEILDLNLNTVKSRLYKGLKTLKMEITAKEVL